MQPRIGLFRLRKVTFVTALFWVIFLSGCANHSSENVGLPDDYQYLLVNLANPKTLNQWRTNSYHANTSNYEVSSSVSSLLRGIQRDYQLTRVEGWPINSLELYCVLFAVPASVDLDALLERINQDSRIDFAEPQVAFELMATSQSTSLGEKNSAELYSDPLFAIQYPKHGELIASLHESSTGKNIRVGIVDSSIDKRHPDLKGRIRDEQSFLQSGVLHDPRHGTAVAGVIGAQANNQEGIVGLAPQASLFSYEACGQHGNASSCNSFTLAKALEYAIQDDLDILNLSIAGNETPLLGKLIEALIERDVILVAAENVADKTRNFPANRPNVHGVGNDVSENLWFAKNEHLSTQAGGGYRHYEGSSVSAAGVTGFAAALLALHSPDEVGLIVKELLTSGCGSTQEIFGSPATVTLESVGIATCTFQELASNEVLLP